MVATFTNGKPRGRPFVKGQPKSAGRKKGVQNIHTRMVRWVIGEVARQIGGVDRLTAWVKEEPQNEFAFWTQIYPRLLPLQVQGAGARGEIEVNVKYSREELIKRLIERGMPTTVFGIDKPMLEFKAASDRAGVSSGAEHAPLRITNGHDPEGGDGSGAMGGA
jgi:hypothetical protein